MKFTSDRLKRQNYDITISLDKAKENNEVITINTSELLRTLLRYKNIDFSQDELDELLIERAILRKNRNSETNKKKILSITEKIEKILFIEDLVSIEFKNKTHYEEIVNKNGFYVNGIKFTPFMASAGMIRKNTAMFINNNIKHPLMDILENNRDESVTLIPAKWGAYFSLYSSSSLPVSFPKIAVIADKEIEKTTLVDFVEYQGVGIDDNVTTKNYKMTYNAWDGQGLISPELAKKWSKELELDYPFSCAIIRAPFMKGLVATFDIHRFATNIAKKYTFTDIYGDEIDIRNVDLIVTESMFKLHNCYKNTEDYIEKCHKNKLGFSITKVNPETEKSYSRTSYQFLQILNLNDADIAKLSEPTVTWFRDISGNSAKNMLLYATGERGFEPTDFSKMDVTTKALFLNHELSNDRYIQRRFTKSISKKKKEAYMGKLLINANYQFMVSDPFYQISQIFGIENSYLLGENEHYSNYWLNQSIKKVGAIRSPIVHHSEFNILNFKDTPDVKEWYKYIKSGIIFPANGIGIDCAIHGGADFDGDLICTINNDIMLKGKISGLPVLYESKKSEKTIVDSRNDKEQVESQLRGHNSKVGFATNVSSSLYAMLEEYPAGSKEHETILKRLKIGRAIQGEIIDSVKGLKVPPFRQHWTQYQKPEKDISKEERDRINFNNKIICNKRPMFFRYLYPHYMKKYRKEIKKYDIYSYLQYGKSFSEILKKEDKSPGEEELCNRYKWYSYFMDNSSVMNKISHYMQTHLNLISRYVRKNAEAYNFSIISSNGFEAEESKTNQMKEYLQEYKSFKKGMRKGIEGPYNSLESFMDYLRKKCVINISSNEQELANYAIEVTYNDEHYMVEFPWKMFPDGILQNVLENSTGKTSFPIQDENGDIEYLWTRYKMKDFSIEEIYEN